jgi:hypothetical protein
MLAVEALNPHASEANASTTRNRANRNSVFTFIA